MEQIPKPVHPADADPKIPRAAYGNGGAEDYEAVSGKCFICRTKGHMSITHYPEQEAAYKAAYWKYMGFETREANRASEARVKAKLQQRFK